MFIRHLVGKYLKMNARIRNVYPKEFMSTHVSIIDFQWVHLLLQDIVLENVFTQKTLT